MTPFGVNNPPHENGLKGGVMDNLGIDPNCPV